MVGDTILIKDISINGNDELTNTTELSETLTGNTINALGIDASSRTIWINGQPYGNAYVNIKEDNTTVEAPIGAEIFNDFEHNIASGEYSHAEGNNTKAINFGEHSEGNYNLSINDKTIHTVGIGTSSNDRKNAEEIHINGDKYVYGIGGYNGTNSQTPGIKTTQTVVNEAINQVTISYQELVELRSENKLVPGKQYRITDYTCTTTQANTRAINHLFDIIVTADSNSTLNEEAIAVQHTGDSYFSGCDLNAWKIWYCLDNDTTRFTWADATNGKGVIYRMIDEWNNDCPYDFKNIQFNGDWGYWAYTFNWINNNSDNSCEDLSVAQYAHTNDEGGYSHTYNNVINTCEDNIGSNYLNDGYPLKLNACVFLNTESHDGGNYYGCNSNTFGSNCHNNTFGSSCYNNTFGNECADNSLRDDCYNNVFGNSCYTNKFGNNCYSNTFGYNGYNNTFGNDCYENSFGNTYQNNTFGNDCRSNTFGNGGQYNVFGSACRSNTFGGDCRSNTFGPYCQSNIFGSSCYYNSFGPRCQNNALGNNCQYNTFGNNCRYIKFALNKEAATKYNFYQSNCFGDGCQYILFKGEETASSKSQVQNYDFAQGLQGTSSNYLPIDGVRNRAYETYISRDTNGTKKESVIADKLDKTIDIEYTDLVALRTKGELIPGQQYRITDYACTTTQANTRAADNKFDIIVTADSKSTLNEEARAIQHDFPDNTSETVKKYFANSDLNAWKIWYCLDNDTNRFAWADATTTGEGKPNGKGVIYRMIDEWNNDFPYDFKNIQFARDWSTIAPDSGLSGTVYCYTFSVFLDVFSESTTASDESVKAKECIETNETGSFGNNVIGTYQNMGVCSLNDIVFITDYEVAYVNHYYNTFGDNCYGNTFYSECYSNSFGDKCYNNTFRDNFCHNTFGNDCYENSFGNDCSDNSFGNACCYNSFGSGCHYNTFANGCTYNVIGSICVCNSFGNGCYNIKFASDKSASTKYNYYRNNHFGDGCQYILFTGSKYSNSSNQVQNYNFAQGTSGTEAEYLNIEGNLNRDYETYISKNTSGVIKESVIAELPNMVNITYTELKTLRDNGQLVPGQQYRITDYTCTTKQENTQALRYIFDIIVTADSESTLNEEARAINHDFDNPENDHFSHCNLSAWKIRYCLDNDTDRFAWANNSNIGRGVIYRMIDEFGNDCPYDFKNIQFKHPKDTNTYPHYYFTFASGNEAMNTDCSLDILNKCYSNTIKERIIDLPNADTGSPITKISLNCIIFIGSNCYSNTFGCNCSNNVFGSACSCNSFGNYCQNNTFGSGCSVNSFGSYCADNSFGNYCQYNVFGDQCSDNLFGNYCSKNSLGNYCAYIQFSSDMFGTTKYDNYQYNHFGDGCKCILFKRDDASSNFVQNYNFAQGLQGTYSDYLSIVGSQNRPYDTYISKSSGTGDTNVYGYCLADIAKSLTTVETFVQ